MVTTDSQSADYKFRSFFMIDSNEIKTVKVSVNDLISPDYNPRRWSKEQTNNLKESIKRFGLVDPIIANSAPERKNIIIGGNFRLFAAKQLGFMEVPVIYVDIPDIDKEKELNLRLNKNTGEFDLKLLAEFDENILKDIGFNSEDLDEIFNIEDIPEEFNLKKALEKAGVDEVNTKEGDIWLLGDSKLMVGDSTKEEDVLKLMSDEKADMCFTDPPYLLNYLKDKKRDGQPTKGFGQKQNRKYLGTDSLPENFTELWMANIAKIQKENFSIIVYENWKNLRIIWAEMEKYWRVKNMLVWHLPNRSQGFSAKYKFFSKHDIAMVGASPDTDIEFNLEEETEGLQEEYETALFAIKGSPQWEGYDKGKKYQPTDFIEYKASDEASSGQGVVFGTKPLEILIPYIKVLTKRSDLIIEPFGGSGSTLIAATKMKRRCFVMEKCPAYVEVIKKRWENLTGFKAILDEK
ncbi:MAG: ParB domain protein nuclease [Candidatus Shapirobacteria bacterium GW2011_GWE1_38_10]|uniref:Methyltransferase n=1 Tax=Candidatus Shapirobacteria bacterium GW2011_GWE1_38_10 TaxID=1618488 RepID=A0A0G0IGY5_9BACT|nr:MAG: ParB domain protein nuclease [Candidatus Shapirobacteria bacterium GW2011_GWF2_37_20]KKQ50255.1 MAG: ParB domain protein nuclease [Candidatus Shapirobacteria bacterium GW2011_GWE1_38_10]KKQ64789.1 MAG: ParB domain protein nuclease [Candidatus Shapirobacteria bacterium GW2011_GWF1_38_23]